MNREEINRRRLEIGVEMAKLAEEDCAARRTMLAIETRAAAFQTELAELDLEDKEIDAPRIRTGKMAANVR